MFLSNTIDDWSPLLQPFRLTEAKLVFRPSFDLLENDDGYIILSDMPGVEDGDINITFHDGNLTVSGERKVSNGDARVIRERLSGAFSRTFRLPDAQPDSEISAALERGVLRINIAKTPKSTPRKILIDKR